jgi:hypothetical protein
VVRFEWRDAEEWIAVCVSMVFTSGSFGRYW